MARHLSLRVGPARNAAFAVAHAVCGDGVRSYAAARGDCARRLRLPGEMHRAQPPRRLGERALTEETEERELALHRRAFGRAHVLWDADIACEREVMRQAEAHLFFVRCANRLMIVSG